MAALLLAILLTLILDQGTATQRMAARLGGEAASRGSAIGLTLAIAVNAVVAAALGGVMAMLLMPDARLLFLGIALLIGGAGHILPARRSTKSDGSSLLPTIALYGLRRAGENAAFAVAGVATFTGAPILAAIGAMLGGWTALLAPLALGTTYTDHSALRIVRLVSGAILLCAGIACAVHALRLVGG